MRITCSRCGSTLARGLRLEPMSVRYDDGAQEPTLPDGVAVIDPEPVVITAWLRRLNGTIDIEMAPANAVVFPPDARIEGAVVPAPGAMQGCCDLDADDKPNQACAECGQLLGTAWVDCAVSWEVRFWPDAVTLLDEQPTA